MKKIILGLLLLGASAFAEGFKMDCSMVSGTHNGEYKLATQADYERNPSIGDSYILTIYGDDNEFIDIDGEKKFNFVNLQRLILWIGTAEEQNVEMYTYLSANDPMFTVSITDAYNEGGYRKVVYQYFKDTVINGQTLYYVERQMTLTCEEL